MSRWLIILHQLVSGLSMHIISTSTYNYICMHSFHTYIHLSMSELVCLCCVCLCVCLCLCVLVCMCVCMCVCVCVCVCGCSYVAMCVYVCARMLSSYLKLVGLLLEVCINIITDCQYLPYWKCSYVHMYSNFAL